MDGLGQGSASLQEDPSMPDVPETSLHEPDMPPPCLHELGDEEGEEEQGQEHGHEDQEGLG